MVDFTNSAIENLAIHKVGNKINGKELLLGKRLVNIKNTNAFIRELFLLPFVEHHSLYSLTDSVRTDLNKVWAISKDIFQKEISFLKGSNLLAKCLYDCSEHHMIRDGELYIMSVSNCFYNGRYTDGIGIFKCEETSKFLRIAQQDNSFEIEVDEGLGSAKLEKGCVIVNTDMNDGYVVAVMDNFKKSSEAKYWKDDFLSITPLNDEYFQTKNYMQIAKDFIVNNLHDRGEIDKTAAIGLLNKTSDYFKTNEHFIDKDFAYKVFEDKETVKAFERHKIEYSTEHEIPLGEEFVISAYAVKKSSKSFKSVLKLDKNFHIYIHGNNDLIEKGYDSTLRKSYYKIYFDEEN